MVHNHQQHTYCPLCATVDQSLAFTAQLSRMLSIDSYKTNVFRKRRCAIVVMFCSPPRKCFQGRWQLSLGAQNALSADALRWARNDNLASIFGN